MSNYADSRDRHILLAPMDGRIIPLDQVPDEVFSMKMLGDGALGARTAYLSRPYADDPTTRGICVFTQEVFDEMIGYANQNSMQVAVHCIGDACLDMVLHSIAKALAEQPRKDHRHGIVH